MTPRFNFLLVLIVYGLVSRVRTGFINSELAEELAATSRPVPIHDQGFASGSRLKSAFLNLRAKFLRTKTSQRWIHTFATESDPTGQTGGFSLPNEDAVVRYSSNSPMVRSTEEKMGMYTNPGLWKKWRWMKLAEKEARARARIPASSKSVEGSAKAMRWWKDVDGAARDRGITKPEIEEIGDTADRAVRMDEPSMRTFRFATRNGQRRLP